MTETNPALPPDARTWLMLALSDAAHGQYDADQCLAKAEWLLEAWRNLKPVSSPDPRPRVSDEDRHPKRDNSDLPEHRVAMVVFTTVRAVDELDGHGIVRHAIRSALVTSSIDTESVVVLARFRDAEVPVRVHDLIEVGTAGINGYIHTRPTNRAYPREVSDVD